jgi:acyl-coenzyme A thioesterase PaaI-like protein
MGKSLEAPGASVARWWNRLSGMPGGKVLFSMIIGRTAPYTGSIHAVADELRPGYAKWRMRDRRAVRNHLNSIHAVALVNLAEVASGTAMLMTLPAGTRGIVTALSITYIKKARGMLTAECRCAPPPISSDTNFDVTAEIRDAANDVVARATVTWLLSPR